MMIPTERYKQIIEVLPILCVDIVIRNHNNEYLLIKRANEPLKGQWWVIGGRVLKGETLAQAALRKAREELGVHIHDLSLIGCYEDANESNPFGMPTPLHSVSVVFSAVIGQNQQIKLDDQSSDWKYAKELPRSFRIKSLSDSGPL
jgi:colanic acid biosynthesis protein WcaH